MWTDPETQLSDVAFLTFSPLAADSPIGVEPTTAVKLDSDESFDPLMNPPVTELPSVTVYGSRDNYWYWEPEYWGEWDRNDTDTNPTYYPEVSCLDVNFIGGVEPVDNANYYLPEGVDADYINNAINHLRSFSMDHAALLAEFYAMYTDVEHEFFLDFDQWDVAHPEAENPSVTYYSNEAMQWVTTSAFEAGGNLMYGAIGIMVGITSAELQFAAAWTQTGNDWHNFFHRGDDLQDRPHVANGIALGQAYMANPASLLTLDTDNCS